MSRTLASLFYNLSEDVWRDEHPFSDEVRLAHDVLHHPYATDAERASALALWLQRHQPCLFGRIAAKAGDIQFCFITERDLLASDGSVTTKITEARLLWKRRALRGRPIHGFMLVLVSPRVAHAAPDENLRRFSLRLQELAEWPSATDIEGNDIVTEWLYLQNPQDRTYRKFVFSVDYFASAGDGRWWHDHRVPGGIAFTANSLGHMVRTQQWYGGKADQVEWALRTAMLTIASAAQTSEGPATWLMEQSPTGPFKEFKWSEATPLPDLERLRGQDCGSYAGVLHTDHAVRREFFEPGTSPAHRTKPFAMDFSYIFDNDSPDNEPFMLGHDVSEAEVFEELGAPSEWRFVAEAAGEVVAEGRPQHVDERLSELLEECRGWELADDELARIAN